MFTPQVLVPGDIMNTAIDHSNITWLDYSDFAYLNRIHHWCGSLFVTDDNGKPEFPVVIVSYDMGREVCRLIRLPQQDSAVYFMKMLALLNNCLAFIVVKADRTIPEKYFHIWMMCVYGVEHSWTKQSIIIVSNSLP